MSEKQSIWQRPILPWFHPFKLARSLSCWRMIRIYLFCLVCAATLIALFYAEENWRGRHVWESYKRAQEAKGVVFDSKAFIPPPAPDEQNFAMTPFLAPLFDFNPEPLQPGQSRWRDTNGQLRATDYLKPDTALIEVWDEPAGGVYASSWVSPRPDLAAIYGAWLQATNKSKARYPAPVRTNTSPQEAAAGILSALAFADPVLEELRTASQRPYSRFNIRYDQDDPAAILLPHLGVLKGWCVLLKMRATAELTLGRTDDAFEDIMMMFRLTRALRTEPIVISQLVRNAQVAIAMQPLGIGLADHQWSEKQLQAFQQEFGGLDLLADMQRALQSERGFFGGGIYDFVRTGGPGYSVAFDFSEDSNRQRWPVDWLYLGMVLAPRGWLYLDQRNYHRLFQELLAPMIDASRHRVSPALEADAQQGLDKEFNVSLANLFFGHKFLCKLLLPALPKLAQRAANAQEGVDMAVLACALERYRLARGQFPETLDALMPQFVTQVPHDIINGEPLHYRRTDDGQFQIYSVGWNGKDDGGTLATNKNKSDKESPTRPNLEEGDWVWSSSIN
jgi:hypothetical protein